MTYVNCAVLAVKESDKNTYRDMALGMAALFKKHGALHVFENWGNDVPDGVKTSFPKAVQAEAGETVVFSFIIWPSKEAREAGMQAVMSDPALMEMNTQRPFDMTRMMHGGFDTIVEL